MTSAQWKQRIANQYWAMCAFRTNDLFSWAIAPGQKAPHVTSYIVTYNVKTLVMVNDKLVPQMRTVVQIDMPASEHDRPTARVIEGLTPFSPNIYVNGKVCVGNLEEKNFILWRFVVKLGKLIAFDPGVTNPDSPANGAAATDWKQKQSKLIKPYPCGRIDFPHPVGY